MFVCDQCGARLTLRGIAERPQGARRAIVQCANGHAVALRQDDDHVWRVQPQSPTWEVSAWQPACEVPETLDEEYASYWRAVFENASPERRAELLDAKHGIDRYVMGER